MQAASVNELTWHRYYKTLNQFLLWSSLFHYDPPDHTAALHWITYQAATKNLMPSTLNQYLSHLQFFHDLGVLPNIRTSQTLKFITGLSHVVKHNFIARFLPPSLIYRIFQLDSTDIILDTIMFQAFNGLRGGHVVQILPSHIVNLTYFLVPPYKKCTTTTVLSLQHIPKKIIQNFLRHATDDSTPIINFTKQSYKYHFHKKLQSMGIDLTSHSARHFFGTLQNFLDTSIQSIGHHLIHKKPAQTTPTYIHNLSPMEAKIVISNPQLFKPLHSVKFVSSVTAHLLMEA